MAQIAQAAGNGVVDARIARQFGRLFQPGQFQFGLTPDFAVIGLDVAGDDFHQRGFTFAVAAQQPDSLAGVQLKVGIIEQGMGAVGDGNIGES